MTAVREYDEMHHLVDQLSPAQVRHLRLLVTDDPELRVVAAANPPQDEASRSVPQSLVELIGMFESGHELAIYSAE